MESRAPIALFVYKRLDCLIQVIESLKMNVYANESDLYIFSDGPKQQSDIESINLVRVYLKSISGFKSVTIFESKLNKGLAVSVINGVSLILKDHESIITLEDDIVTSPNFLAYMNEALTFYKNNKALFSISGYTFPINKLPNDDVYFTLRGSSWGWGTWADRWDSIDWNVPDYSDFRKNIFSQLEFNKMGSDLTQMLKRQMQGQINSWAIRWVYHQFSKKMYTVYPTISKVKNIGNGNEATHTFDRHNRFDTVLDESTTLVFNFTQPARLNRFYTKQFVRNFNYWTRIKYKFLNKFIVKNTL